MSEFDPNEHEPIATYEKEITITVQEYEWEDEHGLARRYVADFDNLETESVYKSNIGIDPQDVCERLRLDLGLQIQWRLEREHKETMQQR